MSNKLKEYRERTDKGLAALQLCKDKLQDYKGQHKQAQEQLKAAAEARDYLQTKAQQIQTAAHHRIATIVTKCLHSVFDDPYTFEIKFRAIRGKTMAELVLVRGDMQLDPMDSTGGGVLDVASFALRLSCLCMQRGKVRPLIVLDEAFKYVSERNLPLVADLLEELAEELNFQFVQVTHLKEMELPKIHRIQ